MRYFHGDAFHIAFCSLQHDIVSEFANVMTLSADTNIKQFRKINTILHIDIICRHLAHCSADAYKDPLSNILALV